MRLFETPAVHKPSEAAAANPRKYIILEKVIYLNKLVFVIVIKAIWLMLHMTIV